MGLSEMVFGARRAISISIFISRTISVDLLGFSHTAISGKKCLVDVRGQRGTVGEDRKATQTTLLLPRHLQDPCVSDTLAHQN